MLVPQSSVFVVRWRLTWLSLALNLCFASFLLVSCSGPSFGGGTGSPSATIVATPAQLPLAKLHWCSKPLILFRDEHAPITSTPTTSSSTPAATATASGTPATPTSPTPSAGTPTTVTDWSQVKPNLGFTVFLPAVLPRGSCLVVLQVPCMIPFSEVALSSVTSYPTVTRSVYRKHLYVQIV